MNTYEITTDVPEGNTYHKLDADECRWEQVSITSGQGTVVGQALVMLVFIQGDKPVAHFKAERVVSWNIKQS